MILTALILGVLVEAHPLIPLVPQSVLVEEERAEDAEMVAVYRENNRRRRKTIRGPYWKLDYDLPDDVTRAAIIDHLRSESEQLHAFVHRDSGNRLTFSILRQDGGETWCQVWATDGNYTLEIVDEAPPGHASFDESPSPSATVVFSRGSASLDREAQQVLVLIAEWLEVHPGVQAEVRGHRGPREDPALPEQRAKTVADAIIAQGISEQRLTVADQDPSNAGFEVTVTAVEP